MAEEARSGEAEAPITLPSIDEQDVQSVKERQALLERLYELQNTPNLTQSQLKELKDLRDKENALRSIEAQQLSEQVQALQMLQRADSKHADRIYNRFGAPPPIKPLDVVIAEEDPDGFIKKLSTYETKDFTYWDKLRRHNTQTVIRRWHTYVPTGEEDTAFYERNFGELLLSEKATFRILCCFCHLYRGASASRRCPTGQAVSA